MTPYQQIEELVELGYGIAIELVNDNYFAAAAIDGKKVAIMQAQHMPDVIDLLYKELKSPTIQD